MKRAIQLRTLSSSCLGVVLAIVGVAWSAPQNESQKPQYTLAEYNAFKAENTEQDTHARLKLLDDFTTAYPDSTLMKYVYRDYFQTYFSLQNYPQAVVYADKLRGVGDKDPVTRLEALGDRAEAYGVGCIERAFQTPEASTKARDAALEGLQLLNQIPKPSAMSDEEFGAMKAELGMIFVSAQRIAESLLKGDPVVCAPIPPPLPPSVAPQQAATQARFNRIIQDLLNEQRQSRPVR